MTVEQKNEIEKVTYAIVDHRGRQYRVEVGDVLTLDSIDATEGSQVELGRALLISKDGDVTVGSPEVSGAKVTATVMGHEKARKILVFKFKKRKRYRKMRGHRQQLTRLKVDSISL